jgi:hypothetical protein
MPLPILVGLGVVGGIVTLNVIGFVAMKIGEILEEKEE